MSSLEEASSVFHGGVVGKPVFPFVVAHPVGVVQDLGPSQRFHQAFRVVEIKSVDFDTPIKRVVSPHGVGQGAYTCIALQQVMRHPSSRIAERTGHDVKRLVHGAIFTSRT